MHSTGFVPAIFQSEFLLFPISLASEGRKANVFMCHAFGLMFYVPVLPAPLAVWEPLGQFQLNLIKSCQAHECEISGSLMKASKQVEGSSREEQDSGIQVAMKSCKPASKASAPHPMRRQRIHTQKPSLLETYLLLSELLFFLFISSCCKGAGTLWGSIRRTMRREAARPGGAEHKVLAPVVMPKTGERKH